MAKKSKNNGPKIPEACSRIKELRQLLGISSSAFARKCGYGTTQISGIMNLKKFPTLNLLNIICESFHVNPQWLIEGKAGVPIFVNVEGIEETKDCYSRCHSSSRGKKEVTLATQLSPQILKSVLNLSEDKGYTAKKDRVVIGARIRSLRMKKILHWVSLQKKLM